MNIEEIEGVAEVYGHKLRDAGVTTTESLLKKGGKPGAREKLAHDTGINETLILKWVNRADLMRVNGVGSEYSDLLEAAGVDSPVELSHRVPRNLLTKFEELNKAKHLVRRLPTEPEVGQWVAAARSMPKVVEH